MDKQILVAPLPIPPGDTLREYLVNWEMTQKELSMRLGMSQKCLNEIVKGKAPLTNETALKLEHVLGLPAQFWINLEFRYREAVARLKAQTFSEDEMAIAKKIPYAEIARLGWVPKTRKIHEKVNNLRNYFGIADLKFIPDFLQCAFRKSQAFGSSELSLATWLQKGEIEARNVPTGKFTKAKLRKLLPQLRNLTTSPRKFDELFPELVSLCATSGIALVMLPNIAKAHTNGAIRWVKSDKIILQISSRGAYADIFWFSLFHELGHIFLGHNKKEALIDDNSVVAEQETAANIFAKEILIPTAEYQQFLQNSDFCRDAIIAFSQDIDIHPGIVTGRLMHEKIIPFNSFPDLRVLLAHPEEDDVA